MAPTTHLIFFGIVVIGLISVIFLLIIFHRKETQDLRDRLMARDFHDYSIGKSIQQAPTLKRADALAAEAAIGGITKEDRAMSDRLPVT